MNNPSNSSQGKPSGAGNDWKDVEGVALDLVKSQGDHAIWVIMQFDMATDQFYGSGWQFEMFFCPTWKNDPR